MDIGPGNCIFCRSVFLTAWLTLSSTGKKLGCWDTAYETFRWKVGEAVGVGRVEAPEGAVYAVKFPETPECGGSGVSVREGALLDWLTGALLDFL